MEKIKAGEGMYLTQKSLVNEGARVFAVSLWLADNDAPENWREATQEEYYEWQRRQDEEMEARMASDSGDDDALGLADGSADGSGNGTADGGSADGDSAAADGGGKEGAA